MTVVHFESQLYNLKDWTILRLPETASKEMPSRGQVTVVGTINGHEFKTVLEPDGYWGHWIRVSDDLQKAAGIGAGDTAILDLEVTKEWPEPQIPADIAKALAAAPQKVQDKWKDITPMARWEWIRWINSTGSMETRDVRIEKTISKLNGTHRRPCCFNLAACTEPYVAKSARLMDAGPAK
jgi:hypothetical protein